MVKSAWGLQKGCNQGPLCYSAGVLKIFKEFRANPRVPGTRAISFIDTSVILPTELRLDVAVKAKNMEWLQEHPRTGGISLSQRKLKALLADGVGLEHL